MTESRAVVVPEARLPAFDLTSDQSVPASLRKRVWRPIIAGCTITMVFVFGSLAAAATFNLAGAIIARGVVAVEANRKVVKHRDGGVVKGIHVREGERVQQGQLLIAMDDTQPRAQRDVLQNQYESLLAQQSRYLAERDRLTGIRFPDELAVRRTQANVSSLMRDQENLFRSRREALESQIEVLQQRILQNRKRVEGLESQIDSIDQQSELVKDEVKGLSYLYEKGLAPKTRLLALQRTAADLSGKRGSLVSEIARTREAIGEAEIQIAQTRQQRAAEVAEGLREVQVRLADVTPRLHAINETLAMAEVRSPVPGFVLNLTQFTIGGVVVPGEKLLEVVPSDAALTIEAKIRPEDVEDVVPGMAAKVQLTAFKARIVPRVPAEVAFVSADRILDPKTGEAYFLVELKIHPADLEALAPSVKLTPGMPALALISTGERTILSYLTSPLTESFSRALTEK